MEETYNPLCPACGQPLDIVIDLKTKTGTINPCTNPDRPTNTGETDLEEPN